MDNSRINLNRGQRFDAATGLQSNLNRWYDASVGRWLSEDPIGFDGGDDNLYGYCDNGPTDGTDPSALRVLGRLLAAIRSRGQCGCCTSTPPAPVYEPPAAVTPQKAKELFDKEKARDDIAFAYPEDGCYARAYLMAGDIKNNGVEPSKVWAFANDSNDRLHVETIHSPNGVVQWWYHVAPTVPVKGADGTVSDMVIDPSLFDKPVTITEWADKMMPINGGGISIDKTKLGEAPRLPDGSRAAGSGYWPREDPPGPGGVEENARDVMSQYKLHEYTAPPTTPP
jgi:RHS repeat-associated protein